MPTPLSPPPLSSTFAPGRGGGRGDRFFFPPFSFFFFPLPLPVRASSKPGASRAFSPPPLFPPFQLIRKVGRPDRVILFPFLTVTEREAASDFLFFFPSISNRSTIRPGLFFSSPSLPDSGSWSKEYTVLGVTSPSSPPLTVQLANSAPSTWQLRFSLFPLQPSMVNSTAVPLPPPLLAPLTEDFPVDLIRASPPPPLRLPS